MVNQNPRKNPQQTFIPLRILGIFRDQSDASLILDFLGKKGFTLEMLDDFHKALDQFGEDRWQLIVIDADHHGDDLPSFFEALKARPHAPPVVAVYNGFFGPRGGALLRLGAFDAIPRRLDSFSSELYMERALAQASLFRDLVGLSRTDGLTGLFNQRYFHESLRREMKRAERNGHPLCLALLDLDRFKAFNDTHGHLEGDGVIARMADLLLACVREGQDTVFRYGGDEFMIIFPETHLAEGRSVVERILQNTVREAPSPISFSAGIAPFHPGQNRTLLLQHADEALYRAKREGGNRVLSVSDMMGKKEGPK